MQRDAESRKYSGQHDGVGSLLRNRLLSLVIPNLFRHLNIQIRVLKNGYVYIMSNRLCTTLYVGVTADLKKRVSQHKNGTGSKFTSKYFLTNLVYYEQLFSMGAAIKREKQLKNWHREWKMNLIREQNPSCVDLYDELF